MPTSEPDDVMPVTASLVSAARDHLAHGDLARAGSFLAVALPTEEAGGAEAAALLDAIRRNRTTDAIVLSGGRSTRMAPLDKPTALLGGQPLLQHVLVGAAEASRRIVVGEPQQLWAAEAEFCREDPPGAGPVAGISAGLGHLEQPLALVLAADLPFIGEGIDRLHAALAAAPAAACAAFVDASGRTNYLAALWRTDALRAAVGAVADLRGAPMRALYASVAVVAVPDEDDAAADCDTPEDLARAAKRFTDPTRAPSSVGPLAWRARQTSLRPGDPS